MSRKIDQIRASKLPSNMMQFAARGALQVSAAENIEILVYLAFHNRVFGELARMTLAGWDEKASLAAAGDPNTPREVLEYMTAPDNTRPKLLPALLENPSVPEEKLAKLAVSASQETIGILLKSPRILAAKSVLKVLVSNPYTKKESLVEINKLLGSASAATSPIAASAPVAVPASSQLRPLNDAIEIIERRVVTLPCDAVGLFHPATVGNVGPIRDAKTGHPGQPTATNNVEVSTSGKDAQIAVWAIRPCQYVASAE